MSVLASGALMAPAGASADPIPDASCVDDGALVASGTSGGNEFATTFRVLQGGYLARARLYLDHSTHSGGTYVVRILAVDGSLVPTTNVLAQVTIPVNSVPTAPIGTPAELVADFPTPPAVHASSHYALSLSRPGSGSIGWYVYPGVHPYDVTPAPCPNSEFWVKPPSHTVFSRPHPQNAVDAYFRTYLTDVPAPITCPNGSIPVNGNCPSPQATPPKATPPSKKKKKKKRKRKKRKRGK